jgi:hypothetical protein
MEEGMKARAVIEKLGLQPHPEGGWYRETWRGPEVAGRASGTVILFLLQAGERSHWHRVDADEVWLWHAGAPLVLALGVTSAATVRLGPDVLGDEVVQAVVPAGWWQAAWSLGDWTLVSCTVSPGFQFEGFDLAPPEFDLPEG